jgi:transcriptional regulator with XRE-family HTH domain
LKAAREAAGFGTAELFAFAFGVEPATYRHWERGTHEPDLTTLQRLCLILRVSVNDLLPVEEPRRGRWRTVNRAAIARKGSPRRKSRRPVR